MMKNTLLITAFFLMAIPSWGQGFLATIESNEDTLIFKISPSGSTVNTNWSDIEFFVRWPSDSDPFSFGDIIVNTNDFPGVSIPDNGNNAQGSESDFINNWFGTSFSATASQTYTSGTDYWVFKVLVNGPTAAADIDFELVHNTNFAPSYLALTDGSGNDMTAPGSDLKFYGTNAQICGPTNCPASTPGTNHVMLLDDAPLPVELVKFEARKLKENDAYLEWITAVEINASHFEIERSLDARNWELIGTEDAQGYSQAEQHYHYTDKDVFDPTLPANLFYYRLKMVDFDGTFEYTAIRHLEFDRTLVNWEVFPNPTTAGVHIQLKNLDTSQIGLELYDALGRVVLSRQLDKNDFENNYYLDFQSANIASGTFFLQLINDSQLLLSERLVVQ